MKKIKKLNVLTGYVIRVAIIWPVAPGELQWAIKALRYVSQRNL
jgi:hypothetical protein